MADTETVDVLKALIESIKETGPTRRINPAHVKNLTPWNPTGSKERRPLSRAVFQNGIRVDSELLTQVEIDKCNLLRPGKYQEGRWAVVETSGGPEGKAIDIVVPNRTMEQRLDLKNQARNFEELLDVILNEGNLGTARYQRETASA